MSSSVSQLPNCISSPPPSSSLPFCTYFSSVSSSFRSSLALYLSFFLPKETKVEHRESALRVNQLDSLCLEKEYVSILTKQAIQVFKPLVSCSFFFSKIFPSLYYEIRFILQFLMWLFFTFRGLPSPSDNFQNVKYFNFKDKRKKDVSILLSEKVEEKLNSENCTKTNLTRKQKFMSLLLCIIIPYVFRRLKLFFEEKSNEINEIILQKRRVAVLKKNQEKKKIEDKTKKEEKINGKNENISECLDSFNDSNVISDNNNKKNNIHRFSLSFLKKVFSLLFLRRNIEKIKEKKNHIAFLFYRQKIILHINEFLKLLSAFYEVVCVCHFLLFLCGKEKYRRIEEKIINLQMQSIYPSAQRQTVFNIINKQLFFYSITELLSCVLPVIDFKSLIFFYKIFLRKSCYYFYFYFLKQKEKIFASALKYSLFLFRKEDDKHLDNTNKKKRLTINPFLAAKINYHNFNLEEKKIQEQKINEEEIEEEKSFPTIACGICQERSISIAVKTDCCTHIFCYYCIAIHYYEQIQFFETFIFFFKKKEKKEEREVSTDEKKRKVEEKRKEDASCHNDSAARFSFKSVWKNRLCDHATIKKKKEETNEKEKKETEKTVMGKKKKRKEKKKTEKIKKENEYFNFECPVCYKRINLLKLI